jgi:hypothetical protein
MSSPRGCVAHVIVIVNPMVALYLLPLLSTIARHDEKVIVIEFYKNPVLHPDVLAEIRQKFSAQIFQYNYGDSTVRYLKMLIAAKRVSDGCSRSFLCSWYIAHPNHILTNHVAFSLHERFQSKLYLIPDGLANCYRVSLEPYRKKMMAKKILARVILMRYRIYTGDYLGQELGIYDAQFYVGARSRQCAVALSQIELALPKRDLEPFYSRSGRVLFVGFDVRAEIRSAYLLLLSKALVLLVSRGFRVFYRPHPMERLCSETKALLMRRGVEVADVPSLRAEEHVCSFQVCAGFFSSALINVKLIYQDQLEVICFDSALMAEMLPFMPAEQRVSVEFLLKTLGVTLVMLD